MIPDGNDADTMNFVFLTASTNFAFTDFEKHIIFTTELDGAELSDSDAMMACLKRAYDRGTPILEGSYLQTVTRAELEKVFRGNIEMPMLDERAAIFREIGGALEKNGSPVVSGDLICVGGHGLWTLPRLWKTPETPGERGV